MLNNKFHLLHETTPSREAIVLFNIDTNTESQAKLKNRGLCYKLKDKKKKKTLGNLRKIPQ